MNSKITIKNNIQLAQKKVRVTLILLTLASIFSVSADAAPPDAGISLRELAPTIKLPATSRALNLLTPTITQGVSGGASITLKTISFTGNTQYTNAALSAVVADAIGKIYDMAGLQGIANRITTHYRRHGIAFARALLPLQPMSDGALVIKIIEGHYGSIEAIGGDEQTGRAQLFLNTLQEGGVIDSASLERTVLILADQPGFKIVPILRQGQKTGTADLDIRVERDKRYSGELGIDNYGNRYTGRSSGHLDLNINSSFLFGDQLKLNMLYSEENMWMGAFNYSLPLGSSGLRASAGYAHIDYALGKEFASSKSHGTAKVTSAGVSYPIIRTQQANLSVVATYQHKELNNSNDIVPISSTKRSDSIPISFNFDRRDQLAGGGITYGTASWSHGDLTVASAKRAIDRVTAKIAGSFNKFNLDLVRLQTLPANFILFGRVSAQKAGNNLDSSEKFGLGGVNGVRAYPSGEAYGDEGVLIQLEIRYAISSFTPYLFYDAGTINVNHTTWTTGENKRSITGAGLGLRFDMPHWSIQTLAAWSAAGKFSDDNQQDKPMVWMSVKYKI